MRSNVRKIRSTSQQSTVEVPMSIITHPHLSADAVRVWMTSRIVGDDPFTISNILGLGISREQEIEDELAAQGFILRLHPND